jgi:hypothetical protein
MLLVLQVRKTEVNEAGSADEKMLTQVEAQLLRSQIDSLDSKKTSLENSLELQTDMNSQLGDPLKQAIAGELDSLMKGISSLRSEAAALESELQAASNEARATQADMQNRTQQAISLKEQIKAVREELEAQKELRTRTMDLPKEQVTSKGMNPVIINEDGLYNVDAGGETGFRPNDKQFKGGKLFYADIVWDGVPYDMRPGTGYPADKEVIRRALASHPPKEKYLLICCRKNGFEKFARYKDILVELGYEYRVVPGDGGISISYGAGKPQKAQ